MSAGTRPGRARVPDWAGCPVSGWAGPGWAAMCPCLLCCAVPFQAVPSRAKRCYAMLCFVSIDAIPNCFVLLLAMPCHAMLFHQCHQAFMPFLPIPYHSKPCHAVLSCRGQARHRPHPAHQLLPERDTAPGPGGSASGLGPVLGPGPGLGPALGGADPPPSLATAQDHHDSGRQPGFHGGPAVAQWEGGRCGAPAGPGLSA